MWRIPISLFGGGGVVSLNFTIDTYIGDLFAYLDSPSDPVEVTITATSADVAAISITNDFAAGSTFSFVATSNGRFIGVGGSGGDGGDDNGATGTKGDSGGSGGPAISSTFDIDIDIDDGFLFGGGGGAGGGSFNDLGATGTPGGGGGGGVGWGDADGGAAGSPTGSPIAAAGAAGSQVTAGSGGLGGTIGTNDGGDGGGWGLAGVNGQFANPQQTVFGNNQGAGGAGGDAGPAFYPTNGAVATFNGSSSEATLRTEGRIKGETDGRIIIPDRTVWGFHLGVGHPSYSYGWDFNITADGILTKIHPSGDTHYTDSWYVGNDITASEYEVRIVADTHGGTWDTNPGAAGTWFPLSAGRLWYLTTAASPAFAGSIFEIRRTDETLAAASGHLTAQVEYEP
jgi:hypothetical protein